MERETRDIDEIRKSKDIRYNKSTIERYVGYGLLDLGNKLYSADDRLKVAQRFYEDYYFSRLETVSSTDLSKVKVDRSTRYDLSPKIVEARVRFNNAIRCIPQEFWNVICQIVLQDKDFSFKDKNKYHRAVKRHTIATMLCFGLDRLIEFYRGKGKF